MTFEDLYAPSFLINIGIMRMKHLLKQWFFIKEIKTRRYKTQVTDHRLQVQIIAQLINN